MRAVLTNLGSLGDVYPLLALAAELRRHHHEPILALPPYFASGCDHPTDRLVKLAGGQRTSPVYSDLNRFSLNKEAACAPF